jgi:uncharacterized protein (TIGR03435 family)
VFVLLGVMLSAQAPRAFDVASIKRTQGAANVIPFAFVQANHFRAPFLTLRELVQAAYGVEPNQVIGGPDWVDADHYEITAALPAGATPADAPAMLRALLADRFGLMTRQEKRELPVYVLESTGKLGPQLAPSGPECKPVSRPPGTTTAAGDAAGLPVPPPPPPPPPPPAGAAPIAALNLVPPGSGCGNMMLGGFFSLRRVPVSTFVTYLSRQLHRPILDRTALTGRYDIDLFFLPDAGPTQFNGAAIDSDAPSLFTAVKDQLGLQLAAAHAPIDVVVIDRVHPPTEN